MIAPPRPPSPDQLELLIREARERQRRRRLGVAAAVAAAAAVVVGVHAVTAGGHPANRPARSSAPAALAAAPCDVAAGWRLSVASRWSEPTMQLTLPLLLTRTGSSGCTVRGYPAVVLLDSHRHVIPFRFSHRGDMVVARQRPRSVDVRGHGSAAFLLNKTICQTRDIAVARRLRVRLPGVSGWIPLQLPRHRGLDFCRGAVFTTVAVSPIVGRLAQAVAYPR